MQLSNFIPQPFQELVVNYNYLKETLAQHPTTDINVQKIAFKVFLTGIHCLSAIALSGLYIGMFCYNAPPLVSILIFSTISLLNPSAAVASYSLTVGIAGIATIIYGIALGSSGILAFGLIFGIAQYGIGKVYHNLLHKEWEKLDNRVYYDSDLNISGFDIAIYDHSQIVKRIINWTSSKR